MDDQNPYQAGEAPPSTPMAPHWEQVPSWITRPVTQLWLLGAGLTVFTLATGGWTWAKNQNVFAMMNFIAAAMLSCVYLGLAVGVYKRSRVAACLTAALWAWVFVMHLRLDSAGMADTLRRMGMLVVIGVVVLRGTYATFRHHRYLAAKKRHPARARISDDPAFAPEPPDA
jgi:hypothetical protein